MTVRTLLLRKLGLIPRCPILLAPRGELCAGALQLKAYKKRPYLHVARAIRLYDGILWHASTEMEKRDIETIFGAYSTETESPSIQITRNLTRPPNVVIANNLVELHHITAINRTAKRPGELRVVFLSRISPKKNLDVALQMLIEVKGQVSFDIIGPVDDEAYWRKCQSLISALPDNVVANYVGVIPYESVMTTFTKYHLFLFPTMSENFGHVIAEALVAGCPVLISDQTPWRGLEAQRAGWDLALSDKKAFVSAIQRLVEMTESEFADWSDHSREIGLRASGNSSDVEANRHLFRRLTLLE